VRLLVDSHAFIWWADASPALSAAARGVIADPANEATISIASLWELTIKASSGKLTLPAELETMVVTLQFSVLAVNFDHLLRMATLPRLHRDPFDRMMIAQSLAEAMPIVTSDRAFAAYGVQVVW